MINKNDGTIAIADMAISLIEFIIKLFESLASGDFSALKGITGGLTEKKDLWLVYQTIEAPKNAENFSFF